MPASTRGKSCRPIARALAAVALAGGSLAAAAQGAAAPSVDLGLPSCVKGSPPLPMTPDEERVLLDAADAQRFQAAAQARFPSWQKAGYAPSHVLLWRRAGHWHYATLARVDARALCFTASFSGAAFDFTAEWVARYRPQRPPPLD